MMTMPTVKIRSVTMVSYHYDLWHFLFVTHSNLFESSSTLSEKLRLLKIQRNQSRLAQLGLAEAKENFANQSSKPKKSAPKSKTKLLSKTVQPRKSLARSAKVKLTYLEEDSEPILLKSPNLKSTPTKQVGILNANRGDSAASSPYVESPALCEPTRDIDARLENLSNYFVSISLDCCIYFLTQILLKVILE